MSVYSQPDVNDNLNRKVKRERPNSDHSSDGPAKPKRHNFESKTKACVSCQKSHSQCDIGRPCRRCIERNIADLCVDPIPKKRGRKAKLASSPVADPTPVSTPQTSPPPPPNNPKPFILSSPPVNSPFNPPIDPSLDITNIPNFFVDFMNPLEGFASNYNFNDVLLHDINPQRPQPFPQHNYPYNAPHNQPNQNTNYLGGMYPYTPSVPLNNYNSNSNTHNLHRSSSFGQYSGQSQNSPPPLEIPTTYHSPPYNIPSPTSYISIPSPVYSPFGSETTSNNNSNKNQLPSANSIQYLYNKSIHLQHLREPQVYRSDRNETPANAVSRPDWIKEIIEYWRTNFPELLPTMKQLTETLSPQYTKIRESMPKELIIKDLEDFENSIQSFRSSFDRLKTPALMWEKSGIIHYANDAYREMTGFKHTTPTQRDQFIMFQQYSPSSLTKMFSTIMAAEIDQTTNSLFLPMEWKCYDRYVDCTLSITIKRDSCGLSMLYIGHLMPQIVVPVLGNQIPSVIKQLGVLKGGSTGDVMIPNSNNYNNWSGSSVPSSPFSYPSPSTNTQLTPSDSPSSLSSPTNSI